MNILLVNPDNELSEILASHDFGTRQFIHAEEENLNEMLSTANYDLIIVSELNGEFDRKKLTDRHLDSAIIYISPCEINIEHRNLCINEHVETFEEYSTRIIDLIHASPEKASQKSEDFYRSIYSAVLHLAKETDFTKKIQIIVDAATELLRAADAAVYIMETQTRNLVPIYSNAKKERDEIMSFVIPYGEGVSGRVAKEGKSGYFNYDDEVDIAIHVDGTEIEEDSRESVLSCPMFEGDKVMGVITVGIIDAKFTQGDLEKLEIFSRMAELEIKRTWALRELNESEEKYRNLVQEISDGIFMFTKSRILFVNPYAEQITGYNEQELLKMSMQNLLILSDKDENCFDIDAELAKGKDSREFQLMTKTGNIKPVELKCNRVKFRNQVVVLGAMKDLTDYKELEKQRIKTEKLESLGVLAGGIAHDFNNMLTGIITALSLIQRMSDDENVVKWAGQAEKASDRAKELTKQLMTFSKGGLPVKRYFNIENILRESATFALRGTSVNTEIKVSANAKTVYADEGQINQVFNNIFINAAQAMPEGGLVKVSLMNEDITTRLLELEEGKYVKITISDEGKGIPYEDLTRIFDPYFTTKKHGSGLGLATAYSVIKNHNGSISAESTVGKGTEFTIYLPVHEHAPDPHKTDEADIERKRSGKILIMDDELIVLSALKEMLTEMGFSVDVSVDGDGAVRKYMDIHNQGKDYDLVILDVTVSGGMGGREAVIEIKEINPHASVIASTAHSNDPLLSDYKQAGFDGIVPKPYSIKELISEIDRVMNNS